MNNIVYLDDYRPKHNCIDHMREINARMDAMPTIDDLAGKVTYDLTQPSPEALRMNFEHDVMAEIEWMHNRIEELLEKF